MRAGFVTRTAHSPSCQLWVLAHFHANIGLLWPSLASSYRVSLGRNTRIWRLLWHKISSLCSFIKPARMASQASNTGCYFLLLLLSHWASNPSGRPQFGGPTPRTPFFMTGGHRPISHRTTSAIQTAHTWRMSSVTSFPTMTQLVKLYSIVKGNLSASNVGVSRDVSVRRTCVNSRYSTSNSSAKASTRPRFGGRRRTRHSA
jgi:hypothetical protein